ncbi:N(4)-(Beta-N-acetylglucosaminyl)-L-asparaginase-like [Elysia marginata]|uniref:N(4)-(Beta-N-acetylglucosaminyl)-L-asparaginase-like n=1 Tax=Elysia marginata TaxID=1093978 RepID=A0AAV4IDM3_9GAST|nr:N(4)-(Beta-N-acetylglucosaminyl)-L-asparaginase-like [Elysia marginata]
MSKSCVVGTWPFSKEPAHEAWKTLMGGHSAVEAIEKGINVAEEDWSYGPYHVGCGGWRNSSGQLQLDAAIMDGRDLSFGAVTALSGYSRAISVARRVLTHSRHSMLTGAGASAFASAHGFKSEQGLGRQKPHKITERENEDKVQLGHDTLGLLCLDHNGNICAGVSTSGAANKEPGRVGDSALPGAGLYADNEIGAACCSGDGDEILKHCPSYRVVSYIRQGLEPQEACGKVVSEIVARRKAQPDFEMVIIALDTNARVGAANVGIYRWVDDVTGAEHPGFPYVMMNSTSHHPAILHVKPISSF